MPKSSKAKALEQYESEELFLEGNPFSQKEGTLSTKAKRQLEGHPVSGAIIARTFATLRATEPLRHSVSEDPEFINDSASANQMFMKLVDKSGAETRNFLNANKDVENIQPWHEAVIMQSMSRIIAHAYKSSGKGVLQQNFDISGLWREITATKNHHDSAYEFADTRVSTAMQVVQNVNYVLSLYREAPLLISSESKVRQWAIDLFTTAPLSAMNRILKKADSLSIANQHITHQSIIKLISADLSSLWKSQERHYNDAVEMFSQADVIATFSNDNALDRIHNALADKISKLEDTILQSLEHALDEGLTEEPIKRTKVLSERTPTNTLGYS